MNPERIERIQKTLNLLKEMIQFSFWVLIAIVAVTALASPSLARAQLARLGMEVREVNLPGLKIAIAQTIAVSDAVSEARASLTTAQATLKSSNGSTDAVNAIAAANKGLNVAEAALTETEKKVKQLQRESGLAPEIPSSAWITVGLMSDASGLLPAARIDKERTRMSGAEVKTVALKRDAIVHSAEQCSPPVEISNAPAPNAADMKTLVILLKAGEYQALETLQCPGYSKGISTISARIAITENAVRLAEFGTARN